MSRLFPLFLLLLLPSAAAWAAQADAARAAMQKLAPMQQLKGFRLSALPGYYEGIIDGQVVYASLDGRYLIRGQIEDTARGENLSEASMAVRRLEVLAGVSDAQRLRYLPPRPRHRITVFTDVDCPYCKRLHAQIADYAALGIGIDYLFFPLAAHPDAHRKSVEVWCAPDRNAAYDAIMAGTTLERRQCANPVAATVAAGREIGVAATPTAIGPDGRVIPSAVLMSPHRLLDELNRIAMAGATAAAKEKTP
ncbi:MAG TPA: DsbC family protein [Dokdonella sp.]|uniref:DsbC family protein n=1 Tax=Dokdonella sp. TaxID=2291710 RepID=UPI0025BE8BC2|nr:DsbC family protein [Dokdonella sp.]MBX3690820.1 DsbC family protein [Dokdonella sp.]MCW5568690.1 DsbC family protein [Dokdonella sp.]HNR92195.1 DsbC family protein [Dokdonella sp.]